MSVIFFEGGAGTGKTTRLVAAVREHLRATPLGPGQQVQALTFMHGARIRLESRLGGIPEAVGAVNCDTVDSFAWNLVRRWRRLAEARGMCSPGADLSFDDTCDVASRLLAVDCVLAWVHRAHPVLVLDEMQDCRGPRLMMVQELANRLAVFAAADEFQDLAWDGGENEAVAWLRSTGAPTTLRVNHRTSIHALLEAATALREGRPVVSGGAFAVFLARNKNAGAALLANSIAFHGGAGELVILSPTGPDRSKFVREVVDRIVTAHIDVKVKGAKQRRGPYPIAWDSTEEQAASRAGESLGLHARPGEALTLGDLRARKSDRLGRSVVSWAERRARLTGRESFLPEELSEVLSRAAQQRRRTSRRGRGIAAMTIHRAKNQEFQTVVVLWPHEVSGSPEKLRRLLYNASTRAKGRVVVIVQGVEHKRLEAPPFCLPPETESA